MKLFYTLALAALCSFGATATNLQNQVEAEELIPQSIKPMYVDASNLVGNYDWTYVNYYDEPHSSTVEVSFGTDGDSLKFVFADPEMQISYTLGGTWNGETSTVSFASGQVACHLDAYDVDLMLAKLAGADADMVNEPVVATYDKATRTITFDDNYTLYANLGGAIYNLVDVFDAKLVNNEPVADSEWVALGEGEFQDCVVGPAYGYSSFDNPAVKVNIYTHSENSNLFRIETPWAETFDGTSDLIIDLTDPEFGKVEGAGTGVIREDYLGDTYIISLSTYYNLDKETFLAHATLGPCNISLNNETNTIELPKGCFSVYYPFTTSGTYVGRYFWMKKYDGYVALPTPAAIDDVTVDADENAPVEYFNLQGVKLENPEAGQVVIRRQGSKVSKIYVK